jgi:uncharacterized membrane protein AbrB (regulator of aidB expression)
LGIWPHQCAPLPPDSGQRGYQNIEKNVQISDRMRNIPHESRKMEFHLVVIVALDITQTMVYKSSSQSKGSAVAVSTVTASTVLYSMVTVWVLARLGIR